MFTGPNSPKKEGREGKAMQVNVDHVAVRHDCSVEQHHKSQIEVESPHAGFGLGRTTERLADKKHPSGYNDSARRGAPDPRLQSLSEITLLGERPTPWGSNHRSNTLQQGSRIYLSSPRGTGSTLAPSSRQTHRVFFRPPFAILPRPPNHSAIKLSHARFCQAKDLGASSSLIARPFSTRDCFTDLPLLLLTDQRPNVAQTQQGRTVAHLFLLASNHTSNRDARRKSNRASPIRSDTDSWTMEYGHTHRPAGQQTSSPNPSILTHIGPFQRARRSGCGAGYTFHDRHSIMHPGAVPPDAHDPHL
ncbi:hypothetical protein Landi51_08709 [Colletotrichum acutatum]